MALKRSSITPREQDFSAWYQEVIAAADLAEHADVRGAMIIKPYGYALWERMQRVLDDKIKETGHQNAYFPLFIPKSFLSREARHVAGFAKETAVVTHHRLIANPTGDGLVVDPSAKLAEELIVRPTSETTIHAAFSRWISSWRDLPVLINQWANVVRMELRPRMFLRTTEFLWQEGHTAHATNGEATVEVEKMLGVYQWFAEEYLAMPVIPGRKTEAEKFAGADYTYTIEAMMQDGKALQAGTSHNLGQNFSKAFEVMFTDQQGERQYAYLTSWGVSTRLIGGLIMSHSDDKGLVLPPRIAPIHVVVVPIWRTDEERALVMDGVKKVTDLQVTFDEVSSVKVHLDDRDHLTMGEKLYEWEKKGVPIRLEVGPRDLASDSVTLVRRDTGEKASVEIQQLEAVIPEMLAAIQKDLFATASTRLSEQTMPITDYQEFSERIEQGGFYRASLCDDPSCEEAIATETKATVRCIPFNQPTDIDSCLKCGGAGKYEVILARAY